MHSFRERAAARRPENAAAALAHAVCRAPMRCLVIALGRRIVLLVRRSRAFSGVIDIVFVRHNLM